MPQGPQGIYFRCLVALLEYLNCNEFVCLNSKFTQKFEFQIKLTALACTRIPIFRHTVHLKGNSGSYQLGSYFCSFQSDNIIVSKITAENTETLLQSPTGQGTPGAANKNGDMCIRI